MPSRSRSPLTRGIGNASNRRQRPLWVGKGAAVRWGRRIGELRVGRRPRGAGVGRARSPSVGRPAVTGGAGRPGFCSMLFFLLKWHHVGHSVTSYGYHREFPPAAYIRETQIFPAEANKASSQHRPLTDSPPHLPLAAEPNHAPATTITFDSCKRPSAYYRRVFIYLFVCVLLALLKKY